MWVACEESLLQQRVAYQSLKIFIYRLGIAECKLPCIPRLGGTAARLATAESRFAWNKPGPCLGAAPGLNEARLVAILPRAGAFGSLRCKITSNATSMCFCLWLFRCCLLLLLFRCNCIMALTGS